MLGITDKRVFGAVVSVSVLAVLVSLSPASALTMDIVSSYMIEGVPLYQQIDAKGCGPAALQMIFDYFGEFVEQKEIYNAARAGGTPLPDMARAAHFSSENTAMGERWPTYITTGYSARSVGYAGFFFASEREWMDGLRSVVSLGYPVAVLQNFYPDSEDPHYRVVVGFDDSRGVFIVNDGWSREFKVPSGYQGSTSTSANPNAWDSDFPGMEMSYADFEQAWRCPTDKWGWPGLMYGAVMAAPWEVELSAPSEVASGSFVSVGVSVTYPCAGPFGSEPFPVFDASEVSILMTVTDADGAVVHASEMSVGMLMAGDVCSTSFAFEVPSGSDDLSLDVWATGSVSGHLEPWNDYPAYDYTDTIGGSATAVLEVS